MVCLEQRYRVGFAFGTGAFRRAGICIFHWASPLSGCGQLCVRQEDKSPNPAIVPTRLKKSRLNFSSYECVPRRLRMPGLFVSAEAESAPTPQDTARPPTARRPAE
jgi:hypothetical protein